MEKIAIDTAATHYGKPRMRSPDTLLKPSRLSALQLSPPSVPRLPPAKVLRERWIIERAQWETETNELAQGTPMWGPVLVNAVQNGLSMPAQVCWTIYHRASNALVPGTVASRRHAGSVNLLNGGSVFSHQPVDDDTDFKMLAEGDCFASLAESSAPSTVRNE